jgi:hypothetical protein
VASSSVEGGDSNIGGLVGINSEGEIGNSEATGDVTGGSEVGGLVGQNEAGTVNSSTAKGTVEGNNRVGGLVGYNSETRNEGGTVVTSYGTGSVSGDEGVGALVGGNSGDSDITESYAVGTVSGNRDTGGLIGVNGASISSSYWDTETTGQSDGVGRGSPDGTTGLTTSEMQGNSAEENMGGFDFQNTWRVVIGDYPALQWEE